MKHTKKLLALLLVLLLAFSIALPATAAVDWDEFRIITQSPQDITVPYNESFSLTVMVNVPEGAQVQYQWYCTGSSGAIDGATSPTLTLSPGDPEYPQKPNTTSANYYRDMSYFCVINAYENDVGETEPEELRSDYIHVRVKNSLWEMIYSITFEPFVYVAVGSLGAFIWVGPLAIISAPVLLIQRYISNLKNLFI